MAQTVVGVFCCFVLFSITREIYIWTPMLGNINKIMFFLIGVILILELCNKMLSLPTYFFRKKYLRVKLFIMWDLL